MLSYVKNSQILGGIQRVNNEKILSYGLLLELYKTYDQKSLIIEEGIKILEVMSEER